MNFKKTQIEDGLWQVIKKEKSLYYIFPTPQKVIITMKDPGRPKDGPPKKYFLIHKFCGQRC